MWRAPPSTGHCRLFRSFDIATGIVDNRRLRPSFARRVASVWLRAGDYPAILARALSELQRTPRGKSGNSIGKQLLIYLNW